MSDEICNVVYFQVRPGSEQAFAELAKELQSDAKNHAGVIDYTLLHSRKAPLRYVLYERFTDRPAHDRYVAHMYERYGARVATAGGFPERIVALVSSIEHERVNRVA